MNEMNKQISLFVPLSQWRLIRREAARRKIPMTELCRQWMRPKLEALLRRETAAGLPEKRAPASG